MSKLSKLTINDIRRGLRKVRTKLRNGEIDREHFDMNCVLAKRSCGTVGCIGGWLMIELGLVRGPMSYENQVSFSLADVARMDKNSPNLLGQGRLWDLFFNFGMGRTPQGAVGAITRYLETNQKVWR